MTKLFFSFLLIFGLVFAFSFEAKANFQDTNALVTKIRARYLQINKGVKTYRKVKKDAEGFSLEGGEMTAYFSNKEVVKISAVFYGETHRTTADFYFQDGKLIFVYQVRGNYTEPMSGKIASRVESRFYFSEDRLIKWLEGKKDKNVSDQEGTEMQNTWIEDAKKLVDIANS